MYRKQCISGNFVKEKKILIFLQGIIIYIKVHFVYFSRFLFLSFKAYLIRSTFLGSFFESRL